MKAFHLISAANLSEQPGPPQFLVGTDVEQQTFNYFFTLCFVCAIFPLPFTWLGSLIRHSWEDK